MRQLVVLAVIAWIGVGCAGTSKHVNDPDDDDTDLHGEVFAKSNKPRFQPTSFSVDVSGSGPPIILIPGLGCPGDVWDDTVAHLKGYQTHVLTLSGFAGRPRIDKPLSATVRKELVRYIRTRHLKHPIIVGHSLGGYIAYWLAATAPSLIGGLVIVDAGPALNDIDEDSAEQLRQTWTQAQDDQFNQQIHDAFMGMANDSARMTKLVAEVARSDRRAMGDAIYEQFANDLRPKLPKITAPVLVVLSDGGYQQVYRTQAQAIPHVDVHVLPRTHHFVMFDDPAGFFGLVDGFLTRVGR